MSANGGLLQNIQFAVNLITAQFSAIPRGEGSVLTTYADDEASVWREFRRELAREGFKSPDIHRHKETIKAYLKELGDRDLLDETSTESIEPSFSPVGAPLPSGTFRNDLKSQQAAGASPFFRPKDEDESRIENVQSKKNQRPRIESVNSSVSGSARHRRSAVTDDNTASIDSSKIYVDAVEKRSDVPTLHAAAEKEQKKGTGILPPSKESKETSTEQQTLYLYAACKYGQLAEVQRLLNSGLNPNIAAPCGRTSSHEAAVWGRKNHATVATPWWGPYGHIAEQLNAFTFRG